ncbi:MAG: T9SS type A sorting domain-containing protein [Bacteroidales bacterium]
MKSFRQTIVLGFCLCLLISAQAQIPAGFHPRYCLYDLEEAPINGNPTHCGTAMGGTGSMQVQTEYSYYKDADGNLQALCVSRQIENSNLEKKHHSGEKLSASRKIKIVPNPAQDAITIEGAWPASVYFFDAFGRLALFEQLNTDLQIDISSLPCGIYSVKMDSQGIIYTLPLLIQR